MDYINKYQNTFFNLPDGTVYYDPDRKIDLKPALKSKYLKLKAMETTTGGVGAQSYALLPIAIDPLIVDSSMKYTPVKNNMKRVTNKNIFAVYNTITDKGEAECYAEGDETFTETDDTFQNYSVPIKYLRKTGKVTGQAMAVIPSYELLGTDLTGTGLGGDANVSQSIAPNIMQLSIFTAMRGISELEEKVLIYGNSTTSHFSQNANGTEFDGFVTQLAGINQTDATGLTITENMINNSIADAVVNSGRPDKAYCDISTFNDIVSILSEKKLITISMEVTNYGTTQINWLGPSGIVKIIPSQFMDRTSGNKSIYFLQSDVWEIRVLQDATYQEFGPSGDFRKFFIKEYITLICRAPTFNSSIINLV